MKNILLSGSISSHSSKSYGQRIYVSSNQEQSFPLEKISGSSAGSVPDLGGNISSINLFVNISQSWSGSINTPQGIVQFINNTQEEFINGEYSGSSLVVADQRLNDCNLSINNSINNYEYFFYFSSGSRAISLGDFLSSTNSPDEGEIYLYWLYDPNNYIPGNPIGQSQFVNPYTPS